MDFRYQKYDSVAQEGKNVSQIFETLNIFNIHKTDASFQVAMGGD